MLYISTKFHEIISQGFWVIEGTQNDDRMGRQMDRWDRQIVRQGDYYTAYADFISQGPKKV